MNIFEPLVDETRQHHNAAFGPFMDLSMLRALLEEYAKLSPHAGIAFNRFLYVESLAARQIAHRMIVGMMERRETL